jgi:hypothetical protein
VPGCGSSLSPASHYKLMRELFVNAVAFNDMHREVQAHGGQAILRHPRNANLALLVSTGTLVRTANLRTRNQNQLAKHMRRRTARTVPKGFTHMLRGYGYAEGETPKRSYRERHRRNKKRPR